MSEKTKHILGFIEDEREYQENKGKSMRHSDAVWATIMIDYLGRSVRRVFKRGKIDQRMLISALAVGVAWLETKVK